ncbi:bifunctional metallophosphatase/5'-nucleotidase [Bacteroidales bacterium OttesenSCG-928-K03]|nr:bifunctional metallophosphatase/5'-nucleotidase [Bacteroidales bacterium OttesenSCG-928-L14]MDL2240317.1 bifunctional metallophosphatase/5'-nucleotidase [Bacteroidales bacterium OttesenSCG-928-K22]MDL2242881.1 bifunctional metallophosphatase/5'-nucleotidase [Bacteroidales bacterium OttesenSCG-928-K03]
MTAQKTIEIIATSDIHGAIFPIDIVMGKDNVASLAHIVSYVNMQRGLSDREILLLDNGDYLQGNPFVYYYNFIKKDTMHIGAQVFNDMGYDCMCIGNHDFEGGHDIYDKFKNDLQCPLLGANVIDVNTGKPYFQAYEIFERCGKKIAVLGLTTPATNTWIPETLISGLDFQDMLEAAKYWVSYIKEVEKPDVLIGLFHSGVDFTFNYQDSTTYKNENASLLVAKQVDGIDVIIAGHDHQGHNLKIKNNFGNEVIIIAPTSNAKDFCSIEINFDDDNKKTIDTHIYTTYSLNINYPFLNRYNSQILEVEDYFAEPLGIITENMNAVDGIFKNDAITNIIHTVQLEATGADISLAAPLSTSSKITKGMQKRKDLFKLYRFDNFLYCMEFTGKEILGILEFSYWQWFNQMYSKDDYLLRYKLVKGELTSRRFPTTFTPPYNYESAGGIIYTVDVSKPYGERVNIISMSNGNKFELEKTYKVAVNSYRGTGGGKHLTEGTGLTQEDLKTRITFVSKYDIKHFIGDWLKNNSPYTPNKKENWKIEPEKLFKAAYNRERHMFNN